MEMFFGLFSLTLTSANIRLMNDVMIVDEDIVLYLADETYDEGQVVNFSFGY